MKMFHRRCPKLFLACKPQRLSCKQPCPRRLPQVVLDTLEYGSAIKKTPVVVGNCTGFAVNRVFFPYTQAACLLVDLGLDPYKIDKAVLGGFGMPMGPFRCVGGIPS